MQEVFKVQVWVTVAGVREGQAFTRGFWVDMAKSEQEREARESAEWLHRQSQRFVKIMKGHQAIARYPDDDAKWREAGMLKSPED